MPVHSARYTERSLTARFMSQIPFHVLESDLCGSVNVSKIENDSYKQRIRVLSSTELKKVSALCHHIFVPFFSPHKFAVIAYAARGLRRWVLG